MKESATAAHDGLLQVPALASLRGIGHAFETRHGRLARSLPTPLARLQQVHGADVLVIKPSTDLTSFQDGRIEARPAADAVITSRPDITLAVATADCVPVLLVDPRAGVIAAVHAGWRGIAEQIIAATIEAMGRELGCEPADCIAAIGPCIGADCYRVGGEVIDRFTAAGLDPQVFTEHELDEAGNPTACCNLSAAAAQQLLDAGLLPEHVHDVDLCTHSDSRRFHSHRRDGATAGRMLAGIALIE